MWILSQDREVIIQTDIVRIYPFDKLCVCTYVNNTFLILGKYKTEERATQVLSEIWDEINEIKQISEKSRWDGESIHFDVPRTYEMPEE